MRRHPSIVIGTGRLEGCSVRRQWGGRRSRTPDAPVVDVAVTNPATLRAVVDGAPLALCGFDQRGRISLWNPACAALFGWSEAEALGQEAKGVVGWCGMTECVVVRDVNLPVRRRAQPNLTGARGYGPKKTLRGLMAQV